MAFSDNNFSEKSKQKKGDVLSNNRDLVLLNDDINNFEYVIEVLVRVCGHDSIQAEQCAFLAHKIGRCQIKNGELVMLKHIQKDLIKKGLRVIIE